MRNTKRDKNNVALLEFKETMDITRKDVKKQIGDLVFTSQIVEKNGKTYEIERDADANTLEKYYEQYECKGQTYPGFVCDHPASQLIWCIFKNNQLRKEKNKNIKNRNKCTICHRVISTAWKNYYDEIVKEGKKPTKNLQKIIKVCDVLNNIPFLPLSEETVKLMDDYTILIAKFTNGVCSITCQDIYRNRMNKNDPF